MSVITSSDSSRIRLCRTLRQSGTSPCNVIGSLIVSLWGTGAVDTVSALSVINILLVGLGLAVALRLGVRVHE